MLYNLVGIPDRLIAYRIAGRDDVNVLEMWGEIDEHAITAEVAYQHDVPNAAVELLTAA